MPFGAKGWMPLGPVTVTVTEKLEGAELAQLVDHALATAFVTARAEQRSGGTTVFRVQNRLPFTVSRLTVRTGRGDDAGRVTVDGLGLGRAGGPHGDPGRGGGRRARGAQRTLMIGL